MTVEAAVWPSCLILNMLSPRPSASYPTPPASPEFDINVATLCRIDIIFGRVGGLVWEVVPFSPMTGP
jgi:hypothetical protein